MKRLIAISGPVSSGKSTLARGLSTRFGFDIRRTKDWLARRARSKEKPNRSELQAYGDRFDAQTGGKWVVEELAADLQELADDTVILDSVRTRDQVEALREAFGQIVTHVHLTASNDVLEQRFKGRKGGDREFSSYEAVKQNKTEKQVDSLRHVADIVIDTQRCTVDDVLVRVESHLRLRPTSSMGYVDVLIGAQYGSEGKGQIASYLSREYDLLVRVGGPNAGHKVFEEPEPYTFRQLPSGTRKGQARLLLGPGTVIDIKVLLKEISDCHVDYERLRIDRNATIILDQDVVAETNLKTLIASTGKGVGAATSRRIMGRGTPGTLLAGGVSELQPFVCDTNKVLEEAFSKNQRVMLEGTQGTGLSLYHGDYPYVTSRDTTAAGCLSEAGIAPALVRRVIMVCRTYPIRVESPPGGTSGPMSQEISWAEVSRRSGIDVHTLERNERTSTTDRKRRVGEFDWALLRRAALLNRPTDIALTFADYLAPENRKAMRFEQLSPETISFIHEVERVAGARVSLIGTGFHNRSVIDRRSW